MKSTARLFGDASPRWLRGFLVLAVCLMGAAAIAALLPAGNPLQLALGIGAAWGFGWHMAWQLARLDTADGAVCLRLFRSNRDAGLIAAAFLLASVIAGALAS